MIKKEQKERQLEGLYRYLDWALANHSELPELIRKLIILESDKEIEEKINILNILRPCNI